jgi:hypothetical protein
MFVTNKRLIKPKAIETNSIKIEIVDQFKLLGVTIDTKLKFTDHVYNVVKAINSKLFAIKRIFYLSFEVKMQFFKTFILPYFDYCLSLIIYFPKQAITKLAKVYYSCLYKLFKFKFITQDVKTINLFLKQYNLFSFEYRVVFKLHSFAYNIKNHCKSPTELKDYIKCKINTDSYNLRESSRQILEPGAICSKYGEWSWFQNFYAKLFNNINISRHLYCVTDFKDFKKYLIINIDSLMLIFVKIFCKFEINVNFCHIYF